MGREKEDKCICKSTYNPSTHYPELSCTVRGTISGRNCNIFSCVVARGRHTEGTSEARVAAVAAHTQGGHAFITLISTVTRSD